MIYDYDILVVRTDLLSKITGVLVGRRAVQPQPLSQQVTARVEHAYVSCSNKTQKCVY